MTLTSDHACPACGDVGPTHRSWFFGFNRSVCAACGSRSYRALSVGARTFYWIIAGIAGIAALSLISEGSWPLPSGAALIACVCLVVDDNLRTRPTGRVRLDATPAALEDRIATVESRFRALRIGSIATVLTLAAIVAIAIGTAQSWTKIDVEAQPATFRSEQYLTGMYDVRDDGVSPCWVGQDWTDCIDLRIGQYNSACVGVGLSPLGAGVCDSYLASIEQMRAADAPGFEVVSLGSDGHLGRFAESATRSVSNQTYRSAQTHEAVCYLGFIGECEWH